MSNHRADANTSQCFCKHSHVICVKTDGQRSSPIEFFFHFSFSFCIHYLNSEILLFKKKKMETNYRPFLASCIISIFSWDRFLTHWEVTIKQELQEMWKGNGALTWPSGLESRFPALWCPRTSASAFCFWSFLFSTTEKQRTCLPAVFILT